MLGNHIVVLRHRCKFSLARIADDSHSLISIRHRGYGIVSYRWFYTKQQGRTPEHTLRPLLASIGTSTQRTSIQAFMSYNLICSLCSIETASTAVAHNGGAETWEKRTSARNRHHKKSWFWSLTEFSSLVVQMRSAPRPPDMVFLEFVPSKNIDRGQIQT